jgi:hypothetical protein
MNAVQRRPVADDSMKPDITRDENVLLAPSESKTVSSSFSQQEQEKEKE